MVMVMPDKVLIAGRKHLKRINQLASLPVDKPLHDVTVIRPSSPCQGEWINENIPEEGGNPQLTENSRLTLSDVGIAGRKHLKRINGLGQMSHTKKLGNDFPVFTKPADPCHVCHSNAWWWRRNEWICGRCHPDPGDDGTIVPSEKLGNHFPVKIATGGKTLVENFPQAIPKKD